MTIQNFILKSLRPALLVAALAASFPSPAWPASATATVPPRLRDAAVLVRVTRIVGGRKLLCSGSGVFLGSRGHVLTAWGVVAPRIDVVTLLSGVLPAELSGDIAAVTGTGTGAEIVLPLRVVRLDRNRGLALLQITQRNGPGMERPKGTPLEPGASATVAAFLSERKPAQSQGTETGPILGPIGATAEVLDDSGRQRSVVLSGRLGDSALGAPLATGDGQLVGIVTSTDTGAGGVGLAASGVTLTGFLAECDFRVTASPEMIVSTEAPVHVEVTPELSRLEGCTCRFALSGSSSMVTSAESPGSATGCSAALTPPHVPDGEPVPRKYSLSVSVVAADGSTVGARSLLLPRYESAASSTPETASAALAPTAAPAMPTPTRRPGAEQERQALAALAGTVKLQATSEDGRTVVDNRVVNNDVFKPNPVSYETLLSIERRRTAVSYDQATFLLEKKRKQAWPNQGDGTVSDWLARKEAHEKRIREAVVTVEECRKKAEDAHVCRFGDGHWEFHPEPNPPYGCMLWRSY